MKFKLSRNELMAAMLAYVLINLFHLIKGDFTSYVNQGYFLGSILGIFLGVYLIRLLKF